MTKKPSLDLTHVIKVTQKLITVKVTNVPLYEYPRLEFLEFMKKRLNSPIFDLFFWKKSTNIKYFINPINTINYV